MGLYWKTHTRRIDLRLDNEEKIIRRIQAKSDRKAANELISAYYREIYAFTYRQVGSVEQAKDLTQDIFVAVLHSINRFDGQKASFRTWLYQIASNKVVDFFRSSEYRYMHTKMCIEDITTLSDLNIEQKLIDTQLVIAVFSEIEQLPFETQQIVRLKLYADQSFKEIADVLHIPVSTAKSKYYAAIKIIRDKLVEK